MSHNLYAIAKNCCSIFNKNHIQDNGEMIEIISERLRWMELFTQKKELINEKYFLLAFKKIVDKASIKSTVNNKNSLGEKGNDYDCKWKELLKKFNVESVKIQFPFIHNCLIVYKYMHIHTILSHCPAHE